MPYSGNGQSKDSNLPKEILLALVDLNFVMQGLLCKDPEQDGRALINFVRRRLFQFQLTAFFSEADILIEAYLRTRLKILEGEHIYSFPGYLRSVSFNIVREYARARKRDERLLRQNTIARELHAPSEVLSEVISQDNIALLALGWQDLSIEDQRILSLRIAEGLPWAKVKEQLLLRHQVECSVVTLRQKGARALKRLRTAFYAYLRDQ